LRFTDDDGDGARRARLRVAGDSAQSAAGFTGRDGRQTTVRDTPNRTGVQARVLRGPVVGRRAAVRDRLPRSATGAADCLPPSRTVRGQLRRLSSRRSKRINYVTCPTFKTLVDVAPKTSLPDEMSRIIIIIIIIIIH